MRNRLSKNTFGAGEVPKGPSEEIGRRSIVCAGAASLAAVTLAALFRFIPKDLLKAGTEDPNQSLADIYHLQTRFLALRESRLQGERSFHNELIDTDLVMHFVGEILLQDENQTVRSVLKNNNQSMDEFVSETEVVLQAVIVDLCTEEQFRRLQQTMHNAPPGDRYLAETAIAVRAIERLCTSLSIDPENVGYSREAKEIILANSMRHCFQLWEEEGSKSFHQHSRFGSFANNMAAYVKGEENMHVAVDDAISALGIVLKTEDRNELFEKVETELRNIESKH